jgi:hypothetical protein
MSMNGHRMLRGGIEKFCIGVSRNCDAAFRVAWILPAIDVLA